MNKYAEGVDNSKITPKAFANFSPGLDLATTLGINSKVGFNPERVSAAANPFRVHHVKLILNPGLELATTLGINSKVGFNPERVNAAANPFRVHHVKLILNPRLSQAPTLG